MLRKGSETTAHVAGFGFAVRGLRPSNTSGAFRQSVGREKLPAHSVYRRETAVSNRCCNNASARLQRAGVSLIIRRMSSITLTTLWLFFMDFSTFSMLLITVV